MNGLTVKSASHEVDIQKNGDAAGSPDKPRRRKASSSWCWMHQGAKDGEATQHGWAELEGVWGWQWMPWLFGVCWNMFVSSYCVLGWHDEQFQFQVDQQVHGASQFTWLKHLVFVFSPMSKPSSYMYHASVRKAQLWRDEDQQISRSALISGNLKRSSGNHQAFAASFRAKRGHQVGRCKRWECGLDGWKIHQQRTGKQVRLFSYG